MGGRFSGFIALQYRIHDRVYILLKEAMHQGFQMQETKGNEWETMVMVYTKVSEW